jgi:type III secretory pathway component EscT
VTVPPELLDGLTAALLGSLRLVPVALASPFLGGPLVPPVVRLALAVGLGLAGATQASGAIAPAGAIALGGAAARELALGTVLAVVAAAPLEAARAGGRLADTLRGSTLSELHVAPIRQRESASGDLLVQWVVVLAAWGGADRLVVSGLLGTFAAVPPGTPFPLAGAREAALHASAEVVASAVAIAAPSAAGVLAADLALALVGRIAPQLGFVSTAQPARAALGLLALAAASSVAAGRLVELAALSARIPAALTRGAP